MCYLCLSGFKSRDTLTRPTLSSQTLELGVVLQSAIKSSAVRHRRKFLEKCESVVDVQRNWKEHTRYYIPTPTRAVGG